MQQSEGAPSQYAVNICSVAQTNQTNPTVKNYSVTEEQKRKGEPPWKGMDGHPLSSVYPGRGSPLSPLVRALRSHVEQQGITQLHPSLESFIQQASYSQ